MLVLERKVDERILIGDDIKITIVKIGSVNVKIGVEAPADVRVDREEVRKARDAAGA
jgi:carbon storage regulator